MTAPACYTLNRKGYKSMRKSQLSEKQLAANRANAARSTGPRTPEGKARSAQNARKHGFTGSTFSVVRLEDLQEIANLRADLVACYQPVNSQELFALERMAIAQQTILRTARLEAGLCTTTLDYAIDSHCNPIVTMSPELVGDIEVTRQQNRNYAFGEGFHRLVKTSNAWQVFLRYQAQAERNYRRALEDFERIKKLRPELPNEPIWEAELQEKEDPTPNPIEPVTAPNPEPVPPIPNTPQPIPDQPTSNIQDPTSVSPQQPIPASPDPTSALPPCATLRFGNRDQ